MISKATIYASFKNEPQLISSLVTKNFHLKQNAISGVILYPVTEQKIKQNQTKKLICLF